jgi:predicted nuclease of predicted toxin-antitoxin system
MEGRFTGTAPSFKLPPQGRDATDPAVWDHAVREGAVIFTKDEDFALRRIRAQTGPTGVWLRVGNSSNPALQRWLMPLLSEIEHRQPLTAFETHNGRSTFAAGTALHAPFGSFANASRNGSVGWIPALQV